MGKQYGVGKAQCKLGISTMYIRDTLAWMCFLLIKHVKIEVVNYVIVLKGWPTK